jgi:hypothetical protein
MTFDPAQHIDQTVTVRGTAYNAQAGAIVELDDRTPIYLSGLESWDDALSGHKVEVTGTLRQRPSRLPPVAPGGEQYHGIPGATFAIEDAACTAID